MGRISDNERVDNVSPDPSSMLEALRAHGYTLPAAVADLIDNSIAAGAKNVWIDFQWFGTQSRVAVEDDGRGMSEEELRTAMKLGSQNPLAVRHPKDLGRFGLGLKTASLSQCRRMTVASRRTGAGTVIRRWDLDHLAKPEVIDWELLCGPADGSSGYLENFRSDGSGTIVLWEILDRLVGTASAEDETARSNFYRLIENVERHIAMVFHRFISRKKLRVTINGNTIEPWDPFLEAHPATQRFPDEYIYLPEFEERIEVKGFVLPHKDKLGNQLHELQAGPNGWNAHQGFYLYRNERMIVSGSWLGLCGAKRRAWTKEEHYKLARIQLDIPNSMDHLWQLDVKKSTASPPLYLRARLEALAKRVRQEAKRVFSHRAGGHGQRKRAEQLARPWRVHRTKGNTTYKIDLERPLIKRLFLEASVELEKRIRDVFRILEETVPVQQIWLDVAEHPDSHPLPFELATDSELRHLVEHAFEALKQEGLSSSEALDRLPLYEEFSTDRALPMIQVVRERAFNED